jgi:hypothetical protein
MARAMGNKYIRAMGNKYIMSITISEQVHNMVFHKYPTKKE